MVCLSWKGSSHSQSCHSQTSHSQTSHSQSLSGRLGGEQHIIIGGIRIAGLHSAPLGRPLQDAPAPCLSGCPIAPSVAFVASLSSQLFRRKSLVATLWWQLFELARCKGFGLSHCPMPLPVLVGTFAFVRRQACVKQDA